MHYEMLIRSLIPARFALIKEKNVSTNVGNALHQRRCMFSWTMKWYRIWSNLKTFFVVSSILLLLSLLQHPRKRIRKTS